MEPIPLRQTHCSQGFCHCSLADGCDGAWFHDRHDKHEASVSRSDPAHYCRLDSIISCFVIIDLIHLCTITWSIYVGTEESLIVWDSMVKVGESQNLPC
jgi:hypothetical protein